MAARYGYLINKWTVATVAALAVMAALFAAALPVWAQQADRPPTVRDATTVFPYNEGDTIPVTTYTASDPDGKPIFWTLGGADASDFTITRPGPRGTLSFKETPDYEFGTGSQGDDNEIYKVTMRFSAGGQDGTPGNDDYEGDDLNEIEVTVTVVNVDEPGRVVISPRQPQVGTDLTAILTDEDGVAVPGTWQWASSDAMNGPFMNIPRLSNRMTYAPTLDDLGKYLRVTVQYVDRADSTSKTIWGDAGMVTPDSDPRPVRKDIVTTTDPPKYPDQVTLGVEADTDADGLTDGALLYARRTTERFIHENSPEGTKVGAPVTAFDGSTSIDPLTYSLFDQGVGSGHAEKFRIHPANGQITVAVGVSLNADVADDAPGSAGVPYLVTVLAVDPDGHRRTINVTIRVLDVNEGPRIDRTYVDPSTDTTRTRPAVPTGHTAGDRLPTEISHLEVDRRSSKHQSVRNTTPVPDGTTDVPFRDATLLDTDLDTAVVYNADNSGAAASGLEPAIYVATDPDSDADDLEWSLEGPDKDLLDITEPPTPDGTATLSFRLEPPFLPDFEERKDANKDNVYEVIIVVTDVTSGKMDKLDVTVKVIDSYEDNEPGKVNILNRQPEIATALVAELSDPDGGVTGARWQWYRRTETTPFTTPCAGNNPFAADDDDDHTFRHFVADTNDQGIIPDAGEAAIGWQKINGATQRTYTPHYDDRVGGTVTYQEGGDSIDSPPQPPAVHSEIWINGDIGVTVTKTPISGGGYTLAYSSWNAPKCLRATVTYQDGAKDRTYRGNDNTDTIVNETVEGTFMGSEWSVKQIDEENDRPVFTDNGIDEGDAANSGNKVSVYRAEIPENAVAVGADNTDPTTIAATDLLINEAFPATDPMAGEDDDTVAAPPGPGLDRLTYSLSGPDAESFVIVGSIDHPVSYDPDGNGAAPPNNTAGSLFIKTSLDYDGDDSQREYRVTITATDPSGDDAFVNVIVNVTNVNERPKWNKPLKVEGTVRYEENGAIPVFTFGAADPENAGIGYSLVTAEVTVVETPDMIAVGQFEDHRLFTIDPISGALMFKPHPDGKARPNYEKPEDIAAGELVTDNEYQVAVRAKAVNPPAVVESITTIYRAITVIVTDVNERPVFSRDTDTLEIMENPDDPEKEPPSAEGYLYLLNRGVGIPGTTSPAAPHLDVGAPVVAGDDDNTGTFAIGGYTEAPARRDRIDGLTYELSGDAGPFHIVPATGQILTLEKLDYETKNTYNVTVKATDPDGASDSIPLTINVTDIDEAPVGGLLTLIGGPSHDYAEDDKDTTLGMYAASGATGVATWTLEGADASHFMLECTADLCPNPDTIRTRNLTFKSVADYEMPRGKAISITNTNTYMVTVKVSAGGAMETVDVTVTVENVEEPGMVELSSTGGKVGTPLTAVLTDDDIVMGAVEWLWSGVDPGSGNTPITGARSFSYTPVFADAGNLLMVTASYTDGLGAGKSASASTTTPVAEANVAPEFEAATATREVAENMLSGTPVGSPITATDPNGDNVTYGLSGVDAARFTVAEDGQLETSASFNYEAKSVYAVTITATDPEGLSGSIAVMVNIVNADEPGVVSLSPTRPTIGTPITASVTDPDGTPTGETYQWSHSTAMGGTFTLYPAENTASITPAKADFGRYLRVTVGYSDGFGAKTLSFTTDSVTWNRAPSFPSATATRSVAENTDAGTNIGTPVAATDADDDTLSYALSGDDAMYFTIDRMGQIMVGANAMLDYETKTSYMVTVTANDPAGASGSIMVTIMVTDANEAPSFPSATATRSVAENTAAGMNIGAPVMAMDDDNDTLSYTLSGTDAASFSIDSGTGQLMTSAALDYETKMSYTVMVTAMDPASASASTTVTIMVTDVDEVVITPDPNAALIARYDAVANGGNGNGTIEKSEVIAAINDYLFPQAGVDPISKAEVIELINLYLFPDS